MITLPQCTLCEHGADPRHGLMTKTGDYYPLCDGCAPYPDGSAEAARRTADLCRTSGRPPCSPLSRFGHNAAIHMFAGVDPQSPEGHLRSVLWQLLGGVGAESVESAAMRVVHERDAARAQRDRAEGELGELRGAMTRLRDALVSLNCGVKP